ncbi:IS21-like element helper ATPase IstB [Proteinivorax hydrogeniformans]|uniref:IS21-like element helper ATPase IstB n=1 Tax=Proteinivorax hydrogeniformans TaxID=1826727 RepID=A0AAU8HV89_9FIRM
MIDKIKFYQKKLSISNSLMDICDGLEFRSKEQFLMDLLEELYKERLERSRERKLKAAKFPVVKTLNGYDFTDIIFPEKLTIEQLKGLNFIENKENLIFYGGPGAGKTHLGIALGTMAINTQKSVLFYTVHSLINELVKAKEEHSHEKLMKKIEKADLLILDEWGYLPLHQEGARLLFEVISLCYERKSIIITTNMEFNHWKNFLFDEKLTVAIIDRLVHHSHLLFFDRESHRKKHALMKQG